MLEDWLAVVDCDTVDELVPEILLVDVSEELPVPLRVNEGVTDGVRVCVRVGVCECDAVMLRDWLRVTEGVLDCDFVTL
jgi:hypothetical protein